MIVYKYGALKPTEGFDLMLQQLRDANIYRNAALEIALARRAALFVGCDKDEVRAAYNAARRALYAKFSTAGLVGHRTLYRLDQAVAKSVSTQWRCWSKTGRFRSPFRRFDGTGSIAANSQHQVGRFAKIFVVDERNPRYAVCKMRVIGEKVIVFPVTLDRPLPEGADLADAVLHVGNVGDCWTYGLTVTVRNEDIATTRSRGRSARVRKVGTGTCAINFGWRVVKEGVRIATVAGPEGTDSDCELILPARMISARKHAESLASLADEVADTFLGSSRRRHRTRREALRGKGPSPLNTEPFDALASDETNPEHIEHWARRDRHLWQWESDERAKMQRQRREIFRLWARKLRAKYEKVVIENYSISDLARQATDTETPRMQAARHIRFLVAPGYLRAEVKQVFGDDCQDLFKAPRTKKCGACGKKCDFDAAEELAHTCEHCGATWDQDANNAGNQVTDVAAE